MHYYTFAAANSGEGFVSFFNSILDEKRQNIYYLKGGPGCGKSTLMKQISKKFPSAELIRCSGDPQSLDGVLIKELNTAIIDATNPHSYEPHYPGVCGNIIDLGEVWETEKLNKEAIISMTDEKKEIYKGCYDLLKAAKSIYQATLKLAEESIDSKVFEEINKKILRQNALTEASDKEFKTDFRYLSAISPEGLITLNDTFLQLGKNVSLLEDRWMLADLMLNNLHQKLSSLRINHICCYNPLLGSSALQHIIIPHINLSIVSNCGLFNLEIPEENIIKTISIQKYIPKSYMDEHKNKMVFFKKLIRELLIAATEKLKQAKTIHMKIEKEYAKGTNYNAAEPLKKKLMDKLMT